MADVQKFQHNRNADKFAKASLATSREKTQYFHYGICEIVNHPTMQGLRDLWASFRGDQLVIKHRKIGVSPLEGKITPAYIIDHMQKQIIFRGLDHNYVIARRDASQQEYVSVGSTQIVGSELLILPPTYVDDSSA